MGGHKGYDRAISTYGCETVYTEILKEPHLWAGNDNVSTWLIAEVIHSSMYTTASICY